MLKAGTETGSLINHLMSGTNGQPEPEINMGMTFLHWTDRSPGTIYGVSRTDGRATLFTCREDNAERIDSNGMSDQQQYRFTPNERAPLMTYRRDRKGQWRKSQLVDGRWRFTEPKQSVRLGARSCYHDFSF